VFKPGDSEHHRRTIRISSSSRRADGRPASHLVDFVSSGKERIEQAKAEWKAGHFGKCRDEIEFIPLPEK